MNTNLIMNYNLATYIRSIAKFEQLPEDSGIEIGFCGRSNVGKSNVINTLTRKNLTHVSKTPGRTRLIHLFKLDETRRIVDLPGYGYARVSKKVKWEWHDTITMYLTHRKCLKGIVLLIDSRHPIQVLDEVMIKSTIKYGLNLHILLAKADKLRAYQLAKYESQFHRDFSKMKNNNHVNYQFFSSLNGVGLNKLKKKLNSWYTLFN